MYVPIEPAHCWSHIHRNLYVFHHQSVTTDIGASAVGSVLARS